MLRIVQNTSASGAKGYYTTADYYTEGQELVGIWRGEGAQRLGLNGNVAKDAWDALCDNRDPVTGKTLTPRQKDIRRVGYDFNFHVPKSVSLLYSLTKDDRILDAFRESVDETMRDMEAEMKTRVRKGGKNEDRVTGNMTWGEFIHFTSRPVDGIPDPHLHAHCFVFNTTFDEKEKRWKAGQFASLKRDAPAFEAAFHVRMAHRLTEMGVAVERTKKGWEVAGITKGTLDKFSRRTALIEEKAREEGITDAHQKNDLGAKTRERKRTNLSFDELRKEWLARLDTDEQGSLAKTQHGIGTPALAEDPTAIRDAVTLATEHCFERKSVVPERTLLAESLRRAVGKGSLSAIQREFQTRPLLTHERDGQRLVTTPAVLEEEKRMIAFARNGRGACERLVDGKHSFKREWLNDDQRRAVEHILESPDRVILIRGKAGVGKTTIAKEAVEAIEGYGHKVFMFAPSTEASHDVLRGEGFTADTVAMLLKNPKLQKEVEGQVWWIDEAGLLGAKTTAEVFALADKLDARLILSGDRRQHGSVERGAALRLLETEAGLIPAEIKHIQRQSGRYRQVVEALSEGRTAEGFRELADMGWIREVPDEERYKMLAADYVACVSKNPGENAALVIAPTHKEADRTTTEIRSELKRIKRLGNEERQFQILENTNLTQAERADSVNYEAGTDVLVFHQNAKGFSKGDRLVAGKAELPLEHAERFQVFHSKTLTLAPGDTIRITRNGKTADGKHRLNNGSRYAIQSFGHDGDIVLSNGWKVSKDFGFMAYGYVSTSVASQGKSLKHVFVAQSADSYGASSREQFYVSVSRGKTDTTIYTDSKDALLDAVSRTDERLTATELMAESKHRAVTLQRMERMSAPERNIPKREREMERAYD
jgi:conjugative relaxase-like TrwC/TraI family protein